MKNLRNLLFFVVLLFSIFALTIFLKDSSSGRKFNDFSFKNIFLSSVNQYDQNKYKPKCKCPYRVISVAGTKSQDGDRSKNSATPFHDFVDGIRGVNNTRVNLNDQNPPDLNNDGNRDLDDVKENIRRKIKKELEKNPKRKVLVVAHSLGAILTQNLISEFNGCVELMPVDPPINHPACKYDPFGLFSGYCREINNSKNGLKNNPNLVNWTNGTADPNGHDPFSNTNDPNRNSKLDDLEKKIQDKIKSCTNN